MIAVIAANGTDIIRFEYNNAGAWPSAANGTGRSLVLRQPSAANNTTAFLGTSSNWRSSTANGGNLDAASGNLASGTYRWRLNVGAGSGSATFYGQPR